MDFETYIRFFAALAFVLALIAASAWIVRRTGLGGLTPRRPGQARRLAVVESIALDSRRRLVLVRRDDVEHLILLGAAGDLLVEGRMPGPPPEPAKGPAA